jgi:LysM repeat protein
MEWSLRIEPIDPPGGPLVFELGEAVAQPAGGVGGWAERLRPRRGAFTEWEGHTLWRLPVAVSIDRGGHEFDGPDVEDDCDALRGLGLQVPGGSRTPILALSGPLHIPAPRWVIQDIAWGESERQRETGARYRQEAVIEFWEYDAPDLVIVASPAVAAAARAAEAASPAPAVAPATASAQPRTVTVAAGQTLSGIAAKELGDHRRWQEIADANGIRDPRKLQAGQVLTLPGPR